jgi:hypothetical protein
MIFAVDLNCQVSLFHEEICLIVSFYYKLLIESIFPHNIRQSFSNGDILNIVYIQYLTSFAIIGTFNGVFDSVTI